MTTIISFDLSLNSPAVAAYNNNIFSFNTLKQKSKLSSIEKLNNINNWILNAIKQYPTAICLIEHNLFNHSKTKNKTIVTLGSINILCQLLCYQNNIQYNLIYPQSWKSLMKKKFNKQSLDKKDPMILMNQLYNINCINDNEGDAVSMIWYYLETHNEK